MAERSAAPPRFARRWRMLAAAALVVCAAIAGAAPNMFERGDYVVHYNALPSVQLAPEVARAARVTRSPNRALLTVAVQRKLADGGTQALPARIDAGATNDAGQWRAVPMRQVRDGDAIYYLGEHGVDHLDSIDYTLLVRPEAGDGAGDPAPLLEVRFRQQFFTR